MQTDQTYQIIHHKGGYLAENKNCTRAKQNILVLLEKTKPKIIFGNCMGSFFAL